VFFSYAVVTPTTAILYINDSKLSPDVKEHLGEAVSIRPYESIFEELEVLSKTTSTQNEETPSQPKKFLVSTKASWALQQRLGGEEKVEEARSPIGDAKAIKNETELAGMRACHVRDGAALTEYFAWLENKLVTEGAKLDEVEGADKLEEIRS